MTCMHASGLFKKTKWKIGGGTLAYGSEGICQSCFAIGLRAEMLAKRKDQANYSVRGLHRFGGDDPASVPPLKGYVVDSPKAKMTTWPVEIHKKSYDAGCTQLKRIWSTASTTAKTACLLPPFQGDKCLPSKTLYFELEKGQNGETYHALVASVRCLNLCGEERI
jgi:hypothetical protein